MEPTGEVCFGPVGSEDPSLEETGVMAVCGAAAHSDRGSSDAHTPTIDAFFVSLIDHIPPEILIGVLQIVGILDPACLIAVAQLSAGYSALAEDAFRLCCRVRQWRLPRVPRGAAAASFRPWRTLFLSHCCRGCHRFGEYPVLDSKTKQRFGLLCRKCTQEPRIHTHMSRRMQTLQTISIDGRQLNVEGKRKRKRKDG
eukprot:m.368373 g.368373  ORF g.368373 m.368373 type:complete len:198 (+) comp16666_c1_seq42:189-782(+)